MTTSLEQQSDHTRVVTFLAKGCLLPVAEVGKLYEDELAELAQDAHITKYLQIFAIRNVQEILRNRTADELGNLTGACPLAA